MDHRELKTWRIRKENARRREDWEKPRRYEKGSEVATEGSEQIVKDQRGPVKQTTCFQHSGYKVRWMWKERTGLVIMIDAAQRWEQSKMSHKKRDYKAFLGLRWGSMVGCHCQQAGLYEFGAQCVCVVSHSNSHSVVWHGCVWFCLLFVVCSTLMSMLHTTTLHAVNRPHAEYVDMTKISSDCNAVKGWELQFVIVMSYVFDGGISTQGILWCDWWIFLSLFCHTSGQKWWM